MNQYRCETCKVPKNPDFPKWCPKLEKWVGKIFLEVESTINKVGCASHSDFQSERERVLDEMIAFCENRVDGYIISLETMDEAQYQFQRIGRVVDELGVIQRKLVELREGKDGE